ncbi:NAD(P)-dependent oxidoreductase [Aurantivibrio plasticivorans]
MKTIGILGTGAMGERIAKNYLAAGYTVNIWNRTPSRCESLVTAGAQALSTPREVAETSDHIISVVRDDEASASVWLDPKDGAINGHKPSSIAIECSTTSLTWCQELHSTFNNHGLQFVDAPIVGSRPQAENKQLIHLLGGEQTAVEQAKEILSVSATTLLATGSQGSGMAIKLAVNTLFGVQVAAFGEMLGLLSKAGVDKEDAIESLVQVPVISPAVKGAAMLTAAENYAPLFPIDLVYKDFSYTQAAAHSLSWQTPITNVAKDIYGSAIEHNLGNENIHAITKIFFAR